MKVIHGIVDYLTSQQVLLPMYVLHPRTHHEKLHVSLIFLHTHNLQAPSQVTGVSLYKEVRQGRPSLRVTWTAPQSDVDISEYLMQYKRNETTLWGYQITISAPTTSAYLSRLYTGTEYDVRVRAVSAAGEGEWSEELTERTFAGEYSTTLCPLLGEH